MAKNVHSRWVSAETQNRLAPFVSSQATTGSATNPEALVQWVSREAYLETTEDLKSYAQKMEYFNSLKKLIRESLDDLRDYDARMKSGQPNQPVAQLEVEKLRLDLLQMTHVLRHRRMTEKSQSLVSEQKAEQVYKVLLRRPFKRWPPPP